MTITDLTPRIEARNGVAVTLYSKPKGCVQCDATKRKFKKEGVEYTDVDVTQDATALEFIKSLGYSQAPVVYVSKADGDHHWSGYDVNEIDEHILGKVPGAALEAAS
ncbi:ribonucleoside-diphosphate reductase class Ib glutaredoxin subunit [Arthrobacter sp. SLBN-83]|uniref:glutaredoxin family protein n=1 Tax=Arthrobacter sp. SLBN-83 TaxID=2768449 RepID=UPI00116B3BF5|nr:ribonucleoside-diphosphate reductase class Ib glutaredoxin subunit [Arthrobacter sp. SLBN-83]